jgi:hypothetical protein
MRGSAKPVSPTNQSADKVLGDIIFAAPASHWLARAVQVRPHATPVFVRMVSAVLYQEALIASQQIQPVSVRQEARVQVFITHTETYKNITVRAVLERLAKDSLDVLLECSARMATAYLNLVILARTAIAASACKVSV